jgi:hypothetical protein
MDHIGNRHADWSMQPETSNFNKDAWRNLKQLVEEAAEKRNAGHRH